MLYQSIIDQYDVADTDSQASAQADASIDSAISVYNTRIRRAASAYLTWPTVVALFDLLFKLFIPTGNQIKVPSMK
jgi:hypothetical protein